MSNRQERIAIRANAHEVAMLKAIAAAEGADMSNALRMLIHRSHRDLFGSSKPAEVRAQV
jgi:predicted DNA binding CopG/RHH family protein